MLQQIHLLDWLTHAEIARLALPHIPGCSFAHNKHHYHEWLIYQQSRYKIRAIDRPRSAPSDTLDVYVELVESSPEIATASSEIRSYLSLDAARLKKINTTVIFLDEQYPWSLQILTPVQQQQYPEQRAKGFLIQLDAVPRTGDSIRLPPPFPSVMLSDKSFFVNSVTHHLRDPNLYTAVITVIQYDDTHDDARLAQRDDLRMAQLQQKIYEVPEHLVSRPTDAAASRPILRRLNTLILTSEVTERARRASTEAVMHRPSLRVSFPEDDPRTTFSYTHQYNIVDVRFSAANSFGVLAFHGDTYTIDVFTAKNAIPKIHFSYTNPNRNVQILAFAFTPNGKELVILEELKTFTPQQDPFRLVWLNCSPRSYSDVLLRRQANPRFQDVPLPLEFVWFPDAHYGDSTLHVEDNLLSIGLSCGAARGSYISKKHKLIVLSQQITDHWGEPPECLPHAEYKYYKLNDSQYFIYGIDVHSTVNIWRSNVERGSDPKPQEVKLDPPGNLTGDCQIQAGILWACWSTDKNTIYYISNPISPLHLSPNQPIDVTREHFREIRSLKICPSRNSIIFASRNDIAEYSLAHNILTYLVSWPSAGNAQFTLSVDSQWCITWNGNLLQLKKLAAA